MRTGGGKVVLDPVHGLMEFDRRNEQLIHVLKARELQRLRRIRQLGLAHLVFPGAEHTRLPHCLGAAYLMTKVLVRLRDEAAALLPRELQLDDEAIRDASLAMLCHDLGHGPFSHAFENTLLVDWDRNAWKRSLGLQDITWLPENPKWHELVGIGLLLNPDGDLHALLEAQTTGLSERIALFLSGRHYIKYLPSLLAGEFDIDRADFLLRDALLTGVRHRFDLTWLIHSLTFAFSKQENSCVVVAIDGSRGTHTIEEFIRTHQSLYKRVYKHNVVRSAELLLGQFLNRLRELVRGGRITLDVRSRFVGTLMRLLRGEALTCEEVLQLDDFRLWSLILDVASGDYKDVTLTTLARMLVGREFPKVVKDPDRSIGTALAERGAHETIDQIVGSVTKGEPGFFWYREDVRFRLLDPNARTGCWFLSQRENRNDVRHIRELRTFQNELEEEIDTRLYVPYGALREVRKRLNL